MDKQVIINYLIKNDNIRLYNFWDLYKKIKEDVINKHIKVKSKQWLGTYSYKTEMNFNSDNFWTAREDGLNFEFYYNMKSKNLMLTLTVNEKIYLGRMLMYKDEPKFKLELIVDDSYLPFLIQPIENKMEIMAERAYDEFLEKQYKKFANKWKKDFLNSLK